LLFIQKYVHHRSKLPAVFLFILKKTNYFTVMILGKRMTSTRKLHGLKLEKELSDIGAVSYGTIYLMTSKILRHYIF